MEEKLFEQMDLLSEGNDEEGLLFFIDTHKELLKQNPIRFIGDHISFYANKEDVAKSLQVVEYYKSAPYISMEVEEFLNEMKEELTKLTKHKNVEYSDDEIKKLLFSKNENAIVSALHILSKKNIRIYMNLIKEFLVSNQLSKYKSLALFILIEQRIDEYVETMKNGEKYVLNPSKMKLPFEEIKYQKVVNFLESSNEDVSVIENAKEILNTVQIKAYPKSYVEEFDEKTTSKMFIFVTKQMMGQNRIKLEELGLENTKKEQIEEFVNEIIEEFNS